MIRRKKSKDYLTEDILDTGWSLANASSSKGGALIIMQ